ncbi:MAG: hypothetical protein PUE83_09465 [Lachnobacterium sp.]|nr:hypothetical protein [Lachnobacterium sp.]
MSKKFRISIIGCLATVVYLFISFFFLLIPININAGDFWVTLIIASLLYAVGNMVDRAFGFLSRSSNPRGNKFPIPFLVPIFLFIVMMILIIAGAKLFHAKSYASILSIKEVEFSEDLPEASATDSIALMDTASAQMLGDREIGALANLVSQFDVSGNYTQIDYQGTPVKISALYYTGFFKWINNRAEGVPGYVSVDPVSMTASYNELKSGMKYVPSAYLLEDAGRHIWLNYPTTMWGNLHFEIDEDGNPYYVASVYDKKIAVLSGKTVSGCIILNPVTGDTEKYDLDSVPKWVDVVYDGNTLCEQYNWYGNLSGGYWNSVISKKGCKKVTSSYSYDEETDENVEIPDYGYVAKDGDIWIYTGVTSVNSDSSNIGFLLANERTGESHYFSINGADEKSAMAAAEGEVQEKRYTASFPSLINVDGNPTYIMVLKDASGLVKLYAAVNVEQYNLVTTASTQAECISKYKALIGIDSEDADSSDADLSDSAGSGDSTVSSTNSEDAVDNSTDKELVATDSATIAIADIKFADIDGNTYIYLITDTNEIYKAKISSHEDMLLLNVGDVIDIDYAGNEIVDYSIKEGSTGE